MGRPKLLQVLDTTTQDKAYSKLNNPVEVTKSGTSLVVPDDIACAGDAMLTFRTPCDCTEVTTIKVNQSSYTFVDASGNAISSVSGVFTEGVYVTIMLDSEKKRAYIQNSANNPTLSTIYVQQDTLGDYAKKSDISLTALDDGEGNITLTFTVI